MHIFVYPLFATEPVQFPLSKPDCQQKAVKSPVNFYCSLGKAIQALKVRHVRTHGKSPHKSKLW